MASGNDYVIQVKKNQPSLYKALQSISQTNLPIDTNETIDNKRGRKECRQTLLYNQTKGIDTKWTRLARVIKVVNSGTRKGQPYEMTHFYISSLVKDNAGYFAKGIRSHWGIENRLHWVKDVVQNEDNSRIRDGSLAANLSLIKSTVINVYRLNGYDSIKMAIEKYCNQIPQCIQLMNKINICKI